jgi:hypothetical protein
MGADKQCLPETVIPESAFEQSDKGISGIHPMTLSAFRTGSRIGILRSLAGMVRQADQPLSSAPTRQNDTDDHE